MTSRQDKSQSCERYFFAARINVCPYGIYRQGNCPSEQPFVFVFHDQSPFIRIWPGSVAPGPLLSSGTSGCSGTARPETRAGSKSAYTAAAGGTAPGSACSCAGRRAAWSRASCPIAAPHRPWPRRRGRARLRQERGSTYASSIYLSGFPDRRPGSAGSPVMRRGLCERCGAWAAIVWGISGARLVGSRQGTGERCAALSSHVVALNCPFAAFGA